ncbi:MAG: hypothetical protein DRR06_12150 [Gammaproteobacteria bacterium]|nr:MAG: hypothetical protein DRR06_12150 [Gammaproteobacteria bacterium]
MDFSELLVGITEIAVALAGFTGVVVVFGSRGDDGWHPGDRLRLGFLLEASLTAGAFSLLSLILYSSLDDESNVWAVASSLWAVFMVFSLYKSRQLIKENLEHHNDIDRTSNRIVFLLFATLIVVQIVNVLYWREFAPFLAALTLNLAGSAMQFTRLIRSAFNDQ